MALGRWRLPAILLIGGCLTLGACRVPQDAPSATAGVSLAGVTATNPPAVTMPVRQPTSTLEPGAGSLGVDAQTPIEDDPTLVPTAVLEPTMEATRPQVTAETTAIVATETAGAEPQPADTATPGPATVVAVATVPGELPTQPLLPTSAPVVPGAGVVWSLSPAPLAASGPVVYESTLSIPTYDYERAFVPTTEDDSVFPYPRLDMGQVGGASSRTYRAVVLENGFVAITFLPELGGRVYRWIDKATGQNLLYENPVIKPTSWGYRGWWLAAGGIEWAFPVEEHGLNEYRPWQLSTGSTPYGLSVTVSDIESRTGMEVGATISLDGGHGYMTIEPWARNNTGSAQPYQLWLNAMLALNGNTMSGQTRFVIPASEVIVHSTGDGGAPGSGATMGWPYQGGRDMSLYDSWTGYLGFFAPNVAQGFTGVYDMASDQGVVRTYSPGWPAGTKIFGPATLSPSLWTDDSSNYIELWSGATSSFWSNSTLDPGASFGWTEQWYPVHGLGGLTFANKTAALRLTESQRTVEARGAVPAAFAGQVELRVADQSLGVWSGTIVPGQVLQTTWVRPGGDTSPVTLRLIGTDGAIVAETGVAP